MRRTKYLIAVISLFASVILAPFALCRSVPEQDSAKPPCTGAVRQELVTKVMAVISTLISPIQEQELLLQSCIEHADGDLVVKSAAFDAARNATQFVFASAGDPQARFIVTVRSLRPRNLLIATRDITAGSQIDQNSVAAVLRPSGDLTSLTLLPEEIVGQTAKRPIAKGAIISATDVKPSIALWAWRSANLWIVDEQYRAVISVTALESGSVGQQVRARDPITKRIYVGNVSGPAELVSVQ
jgi:flagella basal body P-ring formation protein FlgA